MKFEITNEEQGGYHLYSDGSAQLISIGDIYIRKENTKNESCCQQNDDCFNYHGITNALCGKSYPNRFTLKRIMVIQMK